MIVNLHARDAFLKGETGYRNAHDAVKTASVGAREVVALQDVDKGLTGWFDEAPAAPRTPA